MSLRDTVTSCRTNRVDVQEDTKQPSISSPNVRNTPPLNIAEPSHGHALTVAPYLRRETNAELQTTNIYNRLGDDPDPPDAASGTGAG